MFDPNDVGNANPSDDYTRVFAGGVSGGLWVNDDITNGNTSWTLVAGAPANISVTKIIYDPNNTNIIELVIVYLEGGAASNYLFNEIKVGDDILLRGPLGVFVMQEKMEH